MEGNLQAARNLEHLDALARNAESFDFPKEFIATAFDDGAVPARLHEGDTRVGGGKFGLIHAAISLMCVDLNQGGGNRACGSRRRRKPVAIPFSSIRTVTVGFGFAPNLLTLPRQALAG